MEFNTKATQAKTSWQETGFLFDAGSLYDYLAKLKDSRKRRGIRYSLAMINNLVISLLNRHGFINHAHARRVFDACPSDA